MTKLTRFIAIGSLALVILALSSCGIALPRANSPTAATPSYVSGPGGMMGSGHMGGGMMGGGMTLAPARSAGAGGYGNNQFAPTAQPTPVGATPVPVDVGIQINASNSHFSPAQISVKPGETVRFVVTNSDPFLHNFDSQEAGIPFLNLPGNTTGAVTWTAPAQTGTHLAVCTLHPGMSLTLVIED